MQFTVAVHREVPTDHAKIVAIYSKPEKFGTFSNWYVVHIYIGTSFNPYVVIVSFAYFQRQSECAYTQSVLICGGGARSYRCQMKFSK